MSEFIKTQQELRANLVAQIQETLVEAEERGGLDAEATEKVNRIEADIRKADEAISFAQRNEERMVEASVAAKGFVPATTERADVFRSLARGEIREYDFMPETRATLVPSTDTVPVSFYDQVFGVARMVAPVLEAADVITRSSGNDIRIPIYTAFPTATATAAGSALAETGPTFSSILIQPSKFGGVIPVANELLSDAGFAVEPVLAEAMGNAIGYSVGTAVTATLVAAAGSGVVGGTTTITATQLINLAYSVDGAVRMAGAGYMVNTKTLGVIRGLQDTAGNFLYQPGVAGQVDTFAGFPIWENPAMSDIATGVKSALFGDFKALKLVTTGLNVATSTDAYFANDATGYRYTIRFGAGLTHAAKVKYLVNA